MSPFALAAVFIVLVAFGSWINARITRLPREVAMLLVGLAGASLLGLVNRFTPGLALSVIGANMLNRLDFADTVLGYVLGFLLFAGALQVDLTEMRRRLGTIAIFATAGVCLSILIVGFGLWLSARILNLPLPLPWALVFGALISPTDPIAVLATVKRGSLPKSLQAIMQGEALFNDGVGIVSFTSLIAFAAGNGASTPLSFLLTVLVQALGGLFLGLAAGTVTIRAMHAIDDFAVEVTLSIALCMGVYAGAQALHLSGPIGVVGAGLLVGNAQHGNAMSETTRFYLRNFWTLVDEILNATLFLLLGLEIFVVPFRVGELGLVAAAVALVLLARICVVVPWATGLRHMPNPVASTAILVWGGLHGALSLALALSIPLGPEKPFILGMTYAVVAFSIIVQGLTFGRLAAALPVRTQ